MKTLFRLFPLPFKRPFNIMLTCKESCEHQKRKILMQKKIKNKKEEEREKERKKKENIPGGNESSYPALESSYMLFVQRINL